MAKFAKARFAPVVSFIAVIGGATALAQADLFTAGDLVVNVYGVSGGFIFGDPTSINLVEYSTSGGLPIVTDALPTADGVGGATNVGVVGQYGSQSEGNLELSGDGSYLTVAEYGATAAARGIQAATNSAEGTNYPAGTPYSENSLPLAQSSDADVPRVPVFVNSNGNANSSTLLNDVYNTNNPRSLYSANGSTFYISGQGDGSTADQGIYYATTGLNTVTSPTLHPTAIYNAHNTRFVTAYNQNLYYSIDTSSGKYTGIWQYAGTPTSLANATQIIPGNNGAGVFYSPNGFFFANPTTLYVADSGQPQAGSIGDGGIQKWTLSGSKWSLQYTLIPTTAHWVAPGNPNNYTYGEDGFQSITGEVIGTGANAQVELFAVSSSLYGDDPDGLYSITDTLSATSAGAGETFTEIEKAPGFGGQVFKGVAFAPSAVPEPTSLTLIAAAGLLLRGRRRVKKTHY